MLLLVTLLVVMFLKVTLLTGQVHSTWSRKRMDMVAVARQFARDAHGEQTRKYTGLPYVTHTEAVADTVARHGGTEAMVIAALLHDTVEDTHITFEDIRVEFGEEVMDLVYYLNDVSHPEDGNRATRKELDRHTLQTVLEMRR